MIKLLVTDLDDTLYSWISFFIPAFYSMVDELLPLISKDKEEVLHEYKILHRELGSVEYPQATLLLPAVKVAFPDYTKDQLAEMLDPVFHRFNSVRKSRLKLFPQVKETLEQLFNSNIVIVGYTESAEENGFYRLNRLGIDRFFSKVYVSNSDYERPSHISSSSKTKIIHEKKPNATVLLHILESEGVSTHEAVYIGDSLTKDIYMAKKANVASVLCKYPSSPDAAELYQKLVAISHWTEADFQREAELKSKCKQENICPDFTIESFGELIGVIEKLNGE